MSILRKGEEVADMPNESLINKSGQSGSYMDPEALRHVDVRTVELDELVDIRNVVIDTNLPKEQRKEQFLHQIRNPYCFKVGSIAVSVGFSNDGITFEQRMEQYLQSL